MPLREETVTEVAATEASAADEQPETALNEPVGAIAQYLDHQQRYQLLEPLPSVSLASKDGVEARVLDCQPYQPSLLEVVSLNGDDLEEDGSDRGVVLNPANIPLVQIYLDLQSQFDLTLPQIHDAWEQDGQLILVVEDRHNLPAIFDFWKDEKVLPLQRLHWLYQMTDLWDLLEIYECRRSLLEISNLRIDEDYLLCLRRLYLDSPDRPPELKDLGQLWQKLFSSLAAAQPDSLVQLVEKLVAGDVSSLTSLRLQLEAIANELQPAVPPPPPENWQAAMPLPPDNEMENIEDEDSWAEEEYATEGEDTPTVVLPMKLINLEDAGLTDVGRQRDHNEDCYIIQSQIKKLEGPAGRNLSVRGLYILCDGMGGHAGGEVASALATETLKQYFETCWGDRLPSESEIREGIQLANKAIHDLNQQNASSGSARMGTTLVLVMIQDTQAAIAHIGDSRLYRYSRRRGLEQITIDHEVGQREIQRGVEPAIAYARPDAYQLTQALGPRDENFISPDIQFIELNEDLLLLVCSDGLSDNDLLEAHWPTHVEPMLTSQPNLEQGVNQLIDLANQYNGHDNITAIAIRVRVRPNLEHLKRSV